MSDEPNIQPESETLPCQQLSEEERVAVERVNQILNDRWARSHGRPFWTGNTWNENMVRRLGDADYERVKD